MTKEETVHYLLSQIIDTELSNEPADAYGCRVFDLDVLLELIKFTNFSFTVNLKPLETPTNYEGTFKALRALGYSAYKVGNMLSIRRRIGEQIADTPNKLYHYAHKSLAEGIEKEGLLLSKSKNEKPLISIFTDKEIKSSVCWLHNTTDNNPNNYDIWEINNKDGKFIVYQDTDWCRTDPNCGLILQDVSPELIKKWNTK